VAIGNGGSGQHARRHRDDTGIRRDGAVRRVHPHPPARAVPRHPRRRRREPDFARWSGEAAGDKRADAAADFEILAFQQVRVPVPHAQPPRIGGGNETRFPVHHRRRPRFFPQVRDRLGDADIGAGQRAGRGDVGKRLPRRVEIRQFRFRRPSSADIAPPFANAVRADQRVAMGFREFGQRIGGGVVQPRRAKIDRLAMQIDRPGPPADSVPGLQDHGVQPCRAQRGGGREAGHACPDHHDIDAHDKVLRKNTRSNPPCA
jgi:hypothetical protein